MIPAESCECRLYFRIHQPTYYIYKHVLSEQSPYSEQNPWKSKAMHRRAHVNRDRVFKVPIHILMAPKIHMDVFSIQIYIIYCYGDSILRYYHHHTLNIQTRTAKIYIEDDEFPASICRYLFCLRFGDASCAASVFQHISENISQILFMCAHTKYCTL